jgi:DNA-binding GntR family transcriptional regulator
MPLIKENAAERVRRELEKEINEGIRPPGEPLDELELMMRFSVSRTPVRTAILQLAAHGLITIIPRSGTFVARMSPQSLLSMLEVLAVMEAASARLAAERMSTRDRLALKALHESAEVYANNQDGDAYETYNAKWHGVIYDGSLNLYLKEQILFIRRRTKVYRQRVFQDPRRISTSYIEHGKVCDAICSGNAEDAHRHMFDHIAGSTKDFLKLLSWAPGLLAENEVPVKRTEKRKDIDLRSAR